MKKLFSMILLAVLLSACHGSATPATTAIPTTNPTVPSTAVATLPSSTLAPTLAVTSTPGITATASASPTPLPVRFGVIGDFGSGDQAEADVSALVHGWAPDFIITVGDDNYPDGAAATIDANIGQFYHDYISPYTGSYGAGASLNRFFPTLGNHDWYTAGAQPYLDYFSLPGNERYYDFTWGNLHFFALDSDPNEPDGVNEASIQAMWLQAGLAASTSQWNVVYFHTAPYASGTQGPTDWMRWPFAAWGADAVLAGHNHVYERLQVDGIPYFTNGLGGGGIYDFTTPVPESQFRYDADHGAMLVTASGADLTFEMYSRTGKLIDSYQLTKP